MNLLIIVLEGMGKWRQIGNAGVTKYCNKNTLYGKKKEGARQTPSLA